MRLPSVIVVLGTMLLFAASSVSQSTTTTTDVYYPTILSAAGNITGLPGGNDLCGSERIRKPWSALRSDEQALYIEATKLAVADGGVAAFAAIAADSLSQAQGEYSCAFFSWYRRLLLAYESYLRTLDERFACLTLHYYDVHTAYLKAVNGDCTNMFDCSDIFQALGGNVKSNEITTSTFNGIEATGYAVTGFSSKNVVRNDLSTKFIPSAASFSTFQSVVATSVDYATFLQGIKYGVHDEVLNAIGGTFATAAAANDVLYYSWYTSLDMYWHVYHLCRIGVPLTNDEIVESLEVFANSTQTCGGVAGVDAETPLVMRIKVDGELVDVSKHPKLGKFFAFTGNLNWNYASIQQLGEYSYTYELPEMFRQQILSNNDMCTGFNRAFAATYTTLNATAVKSTMTTKTSTTTRTTTTTKIVNGKKVTTTKVSKVTTTSNRSSASTAYSTATTGQLMSRYNYTYLGNFSTGNVVFGEGTIVSNGYTGYKAYYSNGAITTKHNGIISTSASTTSGSIDSTYSKMSNMVMNVMVGTKSVARNVTVSVATSGSYWAWLSTAYNGLYTRFEGNVDLVATHMKLLECYTFERVYGLSNLTSTFVTDKNLVTDRVDCGQRMDLVRSGLLQLAVRSTSYSSKSLKFASSTVIKTILTSYKRVFTRNVSYIRRSYTQKVQNDLDSTEQSLDNITITSNSGLGNNETSSIVVNTGYIMSKTTSMTQQNAGISNTVTTITTTTAANASDTLSEASSADDVRSTLGGNAKSITGPKTKMTGSNGKSVSTTTHPNDETTATTKSDSVHTTVTAGSGDLTTATGSSSPAASNTAMTPKTKSGATPPGATSAPVMPGATPSPVMPDATPAPVMPGATPAQVMPGTIPVPVMLGTTPAPVMPGAIPSLTTPDTTPSPVMPDATPAQMIPGATPAQVMPGTTPAPVMPGATPAPEIPGITPVPVMPGAIPAPTTPGATPAPVLPGATSALVMPSATSAPVMPGATPPPGRPGAIPSLTTPDTTPSPVMPDATPAQVMPGTTPVPVMPGTTPAPVMPGAIPSLTTPGATPSPVMPDATPAQMIPGATPAQVMPGSTPAPVMPGTNPAPEIPGITPVPVMPGAYPAPTTPGATPAPVLPGATSAPVMPSAIYALVMPGATPAQMMPGATPYQMMPGAIPVPVISGAIPVPVMPGAIPVPVTPGATLAPVVPGAIPAVVMPGVTSAQMMPGATPSPVMPSGTYALVMPGATPAPTTLVVIVVPMTPGMATAHMMPGATPVHVMPGDTPVPTMPCPTPAPTLPCPCAAPTMPGAAPVPTMKHSETCINVSVEGDATYCIAGPICSGSGDSPNGSMCPMEGDVAVGDCHDTLASYQNSSTCIAPENARCAKTHTGVWGCVFDMRKAAPTPAPTTATYMATRSPATSESDKHTSLYSATPEMTKSAAAPCTTGPSEETATDVSTTTGIKTATTASTDQQEDYTIEKQHPSALSSSNQKLSTSYAATTLASGNSNSNSNSGNGGVTLVLSICAAVAAVVALAGFTVFKMKQRPSNTVASPGAYYIQPTTPNTDSTRL
ncbi:unnamed protein product [Peronospora effusa]|nr:unnamed protein product [Peronospora effusa]